MDRSNTYDDFLQKLTMHDILSAAGYRLNRRDGMRYPSYVRYDSEGVRIRGDKFIITAGGKCCFQPPEQKVYNIISLIKQHPQFFAEYTPGMSLDYLVNLVCSRLLHTPLRNSYSDSRLDIREARPFDINSYDIHRFNPQERKTQTKFYPYFKTRGIDLNTQYAFRKFFFLVSKKHNDGKVYSNLAFPLVVPTDEEQHIVGLEERGRIHNDGTAYKGKAEGSNASEGLWVANLTGRSLKDAKKVFWFESAYDAMAYYQLCRMEGRSMNAVYVSTGGNPTVRQLNGMLAAAPAAVHHLCFDNDSAGRRFTINYAYTPTLEWRDYVNSMRDPLDLRSGETDFLPKTVSQFYCKAENADIEYLSSRSGGLLCPADLESLKNEAASASREYNRKLEESLPVREQIFIETVPGGHKDWNDVLLDKIRLAEGRDEEGCLIDEAEHPVFRR